MYTIEECDNQEVWDDTILDLKGHPLQLWGWGELKSKHNWSVIRLIIKSEDNQIVGASQILIRKLPLFFKQLDYIPRGPVYKSNEQEVVYSELVKYCKASLGGIALVIEPDSVDAPKYKGWHKSLNTILIPHTLILDLNKSEADLLADMAKKTRQYIRKSTKDGVVIKKVDSKEDIATILDIYHLTAKRAGFAIHSDDYYYDVANSLGESSVLFIAYKDNVAISFLWLAISGTTAFELYGGMNDIGQNLRANYALKWHAILACKRWGVSRYDLNGLLNDGVSEFKRNFAKHEDNLAGTFDYPLSFYYSLWAKFLPFFKTLVRKIKSLR